MTELQQDIATTPPSLPPCSSSLLVLTWTFAGPEVLVSRFHPQWPHSKRNVVPLSLCHCSYPFVSSYIRTANEYSNGVVTEESGDMSADGSIHEFSPRVGVWRGILYRPVISYVPLVLIVAEKARAWFERYFHAMCQVFAKLAAAARNRGIYCKNNTRKRVHSGLFSSLIGSKSITIWHVLQETKCKCVFVI